jgi:hypothetical protein
MDGKVAAARNDLDRLNKTLRDVQKRIGHTREFILRAQSAENGFANMDEYILCLAQYASPTLRARSGVTTLDQKGGARTADKGMRYGADVRVAVRERLEAGESVGSISRALGPSVATIAKWAEKFEMRPKRARGKRAGARRQSTLANGHDAQAS